MIEYIHNNKKTDGFLIHIHKIKLLENTVEICNRKYHVK